MSQKWEYCQVEVSIGGALSGVSADCFIFRAEGKHKHYQGNYGQIIATLGNEGWEMVASSASYEPGKHKINYVFKRQVNE